MLSYLTGGPRSLHRRLRATVVLPDRPAAGEYTRRSACLCTSEREPSLQTTYSVLWQRRAKSASGNNTQGHIHLSCSCEI